MIRAIIFDCFGVLASDGWLPFKRKYFAHDHELFQQAGDLNKQVNAGLADYDEFIAEVAKLAGVSTKDAHYQIEQNPAHDELFQYIETKLKPKYKLGILSNAGANWLSELFTPSQLGLFDATALSYEINASKPDKQAYQIAAERLGVDASECVFVDDQSAFCTAARAVGMQAVVFKDFDQFKMELEASIN